MGSQRVRRRLISAATVRNDRSDTTIVLAKLHCIVPGGSRMALYLVTYDLRKERTVADYRLIYERLAAFVTYCWPLQSVWIVQSEATAGQILDYLIASPGFDDNDGLIVLGLTGNADWRRVKSATTAQWLSEFFRQY
jgi:hypothetical protein